MTPSSWSRWQHWLASSLLLAVYFPANVLSPWLIFQLLGRWSTVGERWLALLMMFSCAFVNTSLALTTFAAHRLGPRKLWALRLFLLVYALPHLFLVIIWTPFAENGWID